jgi:hypothetical protein
MTQINPSKFFILAIITLIIFSIQGSMVFGEIINPTDDSYNSIKNQITQLTNEHTPMQIYNEWELIAPQTIIFEEENGIINVVLVESPEKEIVNFNLRLINKLSLQEIPTSNIQTINIQEDEYNEPLGYTLFSWETNVISQEEFILEVRVNEELILSQEIVVEKQNNLEEIPHIFEEANEELFSLLEENGYIFTQEEKEAYLNGAKLINITKFKERYNITHENGTIEYFTTIHISIDSVYNITELFLIEIIPKEFSESAFAMQYEEQPMVLEEDPVIMWHSQEEQTTRYSYTTNKDTEITGQAVALALIEEVEYSKVAWEIIFPLLFIPIIAGIIIFFARFAPKK